MLKKSVICAMLLMSMMSVCAANDLQLLSDKDLNWNYFATLNKDKNIFYSPYSIKTALSLVANGSEGKTQSELLKVLGVESLDELNDSYSKFQNNITNKYDGGGRLLINSNLILINSDYAANGINANYQQVARNIYNSSVRKADFSSNLEGEKQKISNWVANKTKNFIPDYRSIVSDKTIMDILNVVYFKGDWQSPFDIRYTNSANFTNKDYSKSKVQMMSQSFKNSIKYYENDKYKAIELPYKKLNGQTIVAMYLIMPLNSLDVKIADKWNIEESSYKNRFLINIINTSTFYGRVYVKVPKFELDIENPIVNNLKSIGVQRAFTSSAEFFRMVNDAKLKIDNVNHRAKITVDETGTEAAAVTEVTMIDTMAEAPMPEITKTFYADRPFLFIIRDVDAGVNLFTGVVNKL